MKKRLIFLTGFLLSQTISFCQCDNTIKPSDNSKIAYKARGNRCEGAYVAKVGAPSLDLVGFTTGPFTYKLEKSEIIEIENSLGSEIHIRAAALPLNTYYRMDAALGANKILKWQVNDVLFDLKIPSNLLGVYGWSGTEKEKTFVPVTPVSSVHNNSDKRFYLVIRPSSKVLGIKYRYAPNGLNFLAYENVNKPAQAGQAVVIVLPANLKGHYTMEIAAMLESKSGWVKGSYQVSIE